MKQTPNVYLLPISDFGDNGKATITQAHNSSIMPRNKHTPSYMTTIKGREISNSPSYNYSLIHDSKMIPFNDISSAGLCFPIYTFLMDFRMRIGTQSWCSCRKYHNIIGSRIYIFLKSSRKHYKCTHESEHKCR